MAPKYFVIDAVGFFKALKRNYEPAILNHIFDTLTFTESNYVLGRCAHSGSEKYITEVTFHNGQSIITTPFILDELTFQESHIV